MSLVGRNPSQGSQTQQLNTRALPFVKLAVMLSSLVGHALASPIMSYSDPSSPSFRTSSHGSKEPKEPQTTMQLVISFASIAGLVLLGGVFAGLTLALMGLDELHLQVLSSSGSDLERRRASKVLRLLAKGKHWVLVVLLLGNVIVNETLPIFLSDFGGGFAAVVTSTVLIVIFGEILPQSICARYGLAIGSFCAPLVHATMLIFSPVAWPTAKLLDWCLGEDHGTAYRKAELKTFVSLHQTLGAENLSEDEVTIIRAVLDLNDKTVKDVMTPIDNVYILPADTIMDEQGVSKLVNSGYSRVPVHEPGKSDAILGMLLVKRLIQYDPEDAMPVSWFNLTPLPEASPDLTLLDCLNYFQQGRSHMLLVSSHPGEQQGAMGVVTLEDVIEEMIGEEIIDETDERPKGSGAWAPLIHGIIERRKKHGGSARVPVRSSYGVPASQGEGVPPPTGGRAVDKVRIKRPASPTLSDSGLPNTRRGSSRRDSEALSEQGFSPRNFPRTLSRDSYGALASFGTANDNGNNGNASGGNDQKSVLEAVQNAAQVGVGGAKDYISSSPSKQQQQQQSGRHPVIVETSGSGPPVILTPDDIPEEPGAEERARKIAEEEENKRNSGNGDGGDEEDGKSSGERKPLLAGVKKFFS
ncbi:unnamed protein product [Sympodiomycopsis kandeliae]